MMLLKGQAVLPLFLLVWLSGINFLTGDEGSLEAMIDHSSPTVEKFSNKRDSLISPVLPSDEVVTILGFESDDKDGSGDLLYQDFDVLDVDEINVPMKQNELNISMASPDMMVVKAINYNKKALVELSDFVVNTDVPHGADLEDSELLQDREDHDSEHSGAWSPALVALVKGIPSEQVCHEVAVFPYESSCSWMSMSAQFFGSPADLKVRLNSSLVQVIRIAHQCKYKMEKRTGFFIFTAYNDGCNVQKIRGCHVLTLLWQNEKVSLACPAGDVSVGLPPAVLCNDTSMTVGLPSVSPDDLKVKDHLHWVPAHRIAKRCKYEFLKDAFGRIFFTASYKGCYIKREGSYYILTMRYTSPNHKENVLAMRCPIHYGEHVTTPHSTVPPVSRPKVSCHASTMDVLLPGAVPDQVKVKDKKHQEVAVQPLAERCHYLLRRRGHDLMFTASYKSCHVHMEDNHYILVVVYKPRNLQPVVVPMKCPRSHWGTTAATVTTSPRMPSPLCKDSSMSVLLPPGSLDRVKVLDDFHHEVLVHTAPKTCGYHLLKKPNGILFETPYQACHVKIVNHYYTLTVVYKPTVGPQVVITMKCLVRWHPPLPLSTPMKPSTPKPVHIVCGASSMSLELPGGLLGQVKVLDKSHHPVVVLNAPKKCQYHLVKRGKTIVFTAGYTSCHVYTEHSRYVVVVLYTSENGVQEQVTMKCPIHAVPTSSPATSSPPLLYSTTCKVSSMTLTLPGGSFNQVNIMDKSNRMVAVVELPRHCGYSLLKAGGHLLFTVEYKACDVRMQDHHYTLTVIYLSAAGDRIVQMKCPVQQASTALPTTAVHPHYSCMASGMTVVLPYGSLDQVKIVGNLGQEIVASKAPKHCGYKLVKGKGTITFSASYTACDIQVENHHYILHMSYKPAIGNPMTVTLSCPLGGDPFKTTTPATSTRKPSFPIECKTSSMAVALPAVSPNDVQVVDQSGHPVHVISAPKTCGYTLEMKGKMLVLTALYKACHVSIQHAHYVLEVLYKSGRDKRQSVTMKCPVPRIPPPTISTSTHYPPLVSCKPSSMSVVLPVEFPEQVLILGLHGDEKVLSFEPKECGYTVVKSMGKITLTALYTSCGVHKEENFFVLNLRFYPIVGHPVAVQMKCPAIHVHPTPPRTSPTVSADPRVVCQPTSMTVELPKGKLEDIKLIDKMGRMVAVQQVPKKCGYHLAEAKKISFLIPYKACDVKIMDHHYTLAVAYTPTSGGQRKVIVKCPVIGKPPSPLEAGVSCDEDCMSIDLPTGPLDQVKVVDEYHNAVTVKQSVHCGYNLSSGVGKLHFSAFYKACHVKIQNGHHVLTVLYTTSVGTHGEVQLKCPVHDLVFHQGCDLPRKKQVQCGPSGIYPNVCRSKGCCVDPKTSHCFYPMDTCTSDGHFVFAVYRTSSKPDVDPGSLYVSDHSCAPVICTPDFAVFKIPLTGCGTHRFVIGETSIYLADVFGKRYKNHQIYGQILRHTPYHSQIECRYSKGTHASAGYMVVNSPALPDVVSSGELGIVLRIAKDDGYATFFPDTQVPLRYLLGSKIYLEVKIVNPPTPEVVLLVHYCIAYPRSSENVWVLMYNGCPNALDYGTGLHLKDHNWQPVPKHTRRFDVTTFQFMDAKENLLDEEIYFMCSTEICSHKESCVEGCFDGRQMAVPQSEWGRLCAGKPCPRQLRVERAIADHGSLLQRDVPSTLENGNFLN